ncbi:ribonuclease H-like domain-containing protein [Tanacetum coccineum]
MHTTMVPKQVKPQKIQAGVQVSRLEDKDVIFSIRSALDVILLWSGVGVDTAYPRHGYAVSSLMDTVYWLSLDQKFAMTDLGPLNYSLGIFVACDSLGLFLSQKKYAIEILDGAHMDNYNPSRTPIDTESKLGSDGDPFSRCVYMHDPQEPHFLALKRILRYIRGTLDYRLKLFSSSTTDLVAYSDADWAGFPTTRLSTSGYYVFLGNNLLSWSSKHQPTLSRSNAKAKYRGVVNDVAETCWLRNLLCELHTPLSSATLVYCDNVSVFIGSFLQLFVF